MSRRLRSLVLGLLGFFAGTLAIVHYQSPVVPEGLLAADYWYDTSDPSLVLGEAAFVAEVVVTRIETVDEKSARTVFSVQLEEALRGSLPSEFSVSQLGYSASDGSRLVDGFKLLEVGNAYLIGLTTPGADDPSGALVVLTGPDGGNAIDVTEGRGSSAAVRFLGALKNSRSPYLDDQAVMDLNAMVASWSADKEGFVPVALSDN